MLLNRRIDDPAGQSDSKKKCKLVAHTNDWNENEKLILSLTQTSAYIVVGPTLSSLSKTHY